MYGSTAQKTKMAVFITLVNMLEILSHIAFDSYDNEILSFAQDEVAEWLRRWTANPLGSARVGSNPILVDDFESLKPTHPKSNLQEFQMSKKLYCCTLLACSEFYYLISQVTREAS